MPVVRALHRLRLLLGLSKGQAPAMIQPQPDLALLPAPPVGRIKSLLAQLGDVNPLEPFFDNPRALVVTDDEGLEALAPHLPPERLTHWLCAHRIQRATEPQFIVCSLAAEDRMAELVRSARPGATILGYFTDILPSRAFGPVDPALPAPSLTYAIACAPRSGSTYLCSLLASNGMGEPAEHLRPYISSLVPGRYRVGTDALGPLRRLINGILSRPVRGTKIIFPFLRTHLQEMGCSDPPAAIAGLAQRWVLLVRRDAVAQAVSDYLAAQTSHWHLRKDLHDEDARAEISKARSAVAYDPGAIVYHYQQICDTERWGIGLLEGFPSGTVWVVHYEDLIADPRSTMADLIGWLSGTTCDPRALRLESHVERFPDRYGDDMAARFRASDEFATVPRASIPRPGPLVAGSVA